MFPLKSRVRLDLLGQRFGKLVVVRKGTGTMDDCGTSRTRWVCLCDCGQERLVVTRYLRRGSAKDCLKCKDVE